MEPWIIEEIQRRQWDREHVERPALPLYPDDPRMYSPLAPEQEDDERDEPRRVIVIDIS